MRQAKALISWSSGKDSAWMLHRLRQTGEIEIAGLLTTTTEAGDEDRVAMHRVRRSILKEQAKAARLPLEEIRLPDPCSEEAYAAAMRAFVERALARGITHIAFGDLFLEDVRAYREQRLSGSGLQPLFPLWGSDTEALAGEMIASGLQAHIVSIDLCKLEPEFLGRSYDRALLAALPVGSDPCGEYGEFHTLVSAGPMFDAPLQLECGTPELGETHGHIDFRPRDCGGA
ncbi:MAG: ATP-binding protein [Rhodovibrionaceae bacterium]